MKHLISATILFAAAAAAQSFTCELKDYKPADGLKAEVRSGAVEFVWQGEENQELRASFTIRDGQPLVRELAARKPGGAWMVLGHDLTPEFEVTSGKRRLSEQQMAPLRQLGIALTPEVVEREKWNAFWDAPLMVPGSPGTNMDLPRKPDEVRRAWSKFHSNTCAVKTDGARMEVTFNGLELGIFAGDLRYTVYHGSSLLRQEAIAKTEEPSVAYKYDSGLKGFAIGKDTRVVWRDNAREWQEYRFGGDVNQGPVALVARNRIGILESGGGSLAFLPPSHKFFFAREIETNLGYVYYRKDSETSAAIGVRQAEREEAFRPAGISDAVWDKRVHEARHDSFNFALYNAPPGTWQRMGAYFYLNAGDSRDTDRRVLAYTHDDHYKALPGFQVLVSHFHMHFNEQLADAGTMDVQPTWLPVFRGLGINAVILADFHGDGHPQDTGAVRFKEQKVYFEGCRRFSDNGFLLLPGEEPDAHLGGHYMFLLSHPVYWSHTRGAGQEYRETDPAYGTVYHLNSAADELRLLNDENGLMWQTHPRTKGSAGYPDAVRNQEHFLSNRFLGGSFQSLPVDQSEKRLCEARCLALLDDMNNWTGPKYMIAEGDTYMKHPDDETFPQLVVNYVKMPSLPKFDQDWSPLLKSLRAGDYYVTSGEVLLRNWGIADAAGKKAYWADVEWTFPLEFVELVWGDGKTTGRQVISETGMPPLSNHRFRIPFDPAGKKWVRFAVWDSAGNGALTQPVHLER